MNKNIIRETRAHVIEYRNPKSLNNGKVQIASIYIDGRFEYDTLKTPQDALDSAEKLCEQIDAL